MSEDRSRLNRSKTWKLALLSIAVTALVVPQAMAGNEPAAPGLVRSTAKVSRPSHLLLPAPAGQGVVGTQSDEPIAYVGHGAFFDQKGRQIVPTAEFVAKTQSWYRERLLSSLKPRQRAAFADFEQRLGKDLNLTGQAGLVVRQRSLQWLAMQAPRTVATDRMRGKLNALAYRLEWQLPVRDNLNELRSLEAFELDPKIQARLKLAEFTPPVDKTATANSGAAYIAECAANSVPIPPSIGDLTPGNWQSLGFIPTAEQFIVNTPAEFRVFENADGMCVALPRYNNAQTLVQLDGVICLSQTTGKVCFWDNQMAGSTFSFTPGSQIPIGVANLGVDPMGRYQAGGAELSASAGGVCTDCHAGENPYIIHPDADLDPTAGTLLMDDLNSGLGLPTFAPTRYDPLVLSSWDQNQLSQALDVPPVCAGCHVQGSAGRFPHLSTDLPGYCNTILAQAVTDTMPPFSPGSEVGTTALDDFLFWCGEPTSAGPSNRGDPHLTTTNGINYDFQAAGEFTSLRNTATGFELQTRQTPVLTTFTPGPNAYTGLASCVSLNTAAALRVGKSRISYQQAGKAGTSSQMELRIDGKLTTLPTTGSLNLGGGNTIARAAAGGGIDVRADDGTRVIITPNYWTSQGYWYLDVEVLKTPAREGTMGHIRPSEFLPRAPNGSSFGPKPVPLLARHNLLNGTFADAWRVTSTTSLFDYATGTSTASFTNRNWPPPPGSACTSIVPPFPWPGVETRTPVRPLSREEADRACSNIADTVVRENCVFDVMVTGNAAMANGYTTTLFLRTTP